MLSETYYAKNYASIIGLGLALEMATDKSEWVSYLAS